MAHAHAAQAQGRYFEPAFSQFALLHLQYSCTVGRKRISFTSTLSGWLIANSTMLAKESAGIAMSRMPDRLCATSFSVMLSKSSLATAPGEMMVVRIL